jgi:hypothetical protein
MTRARITTATVRELASAAGIHPAEASLDGLARGLAAMLAAIESCEALDLDRHEPGYWPGLSGGAIDAER